jgi:hypothetical protein
VTLPGAALRPAIRMVAIAYVVAVAVVASLGFIAGSAALILLAAFITLPSSVAALPAYYIVYGLLAQVPGANPSRSSGSGSCTANGVCHSATTGDPASWFTFATDMMGIVLLVAAAVVNVVLLQRLIAARRDRAVARTQPGT